MADRRRTRSAAAASRKRPRPKAAAPAQLSSDIAIVGGGFVGLALASCLGTAGFRVAVIDSADPDATAEPGSDGRASAIAAASRRLFTQSGVWPHLERHATPILDIRVAEKGTPFVLHYDHSEIGDEPMGHMIRNPSLKAGLLARVRELPSVTLLAPARIASLARDDASATLVLEDGRRITAPLVVGADGRNSWTRRQAGIRVTRWRYGQTALVTSVAHEKPHGNVAHELFRPSGPFAILPLDGNRSNIVWCEPHATAQAIAALDDAGFMAELETRFGDFLGAITLDGPRFAWPLGLQYAAGATAPRLALCGDAAHAMHPVAGQGLNVGLKDVAALAEVVADALRTGGDPGAADVLARYVRWRSFDTAIMLAATDGIVRLFSNRVRPLKLVRDLGLAAVNRIPPLRRTFIRHAMGISEGLTGPLPRLLEGRAL